MASQIRIDRRFWEGEVVRPDAPGPGRDGFVRGEVRYAPRPMPRRHLLLAFAVPGVAWLLTVLPCLSFIWRALGRVDAQGAFLEEAGDFLWLSAFPSLLASAIVIPVAGCVERGREPRAAWGAALGTLALLAYGTANFFTIAIYSLRIT